MKVLLAILIAFILFGCSQIHKFIAQDNVHIIYTKRLDVSLLHRGHKGYATWALQLDGSMVCEIEIEPEFMFPNKECYQEVLKHEERHCREGFFHPNENWGYPDLPHCPWSENFESE